MKKKLSKSLVLGKRSIAILSNDSMIKIEGGTGYGCSPTNGCSTTQGCGTATSGCGGGSGGGSGYGGSTISTGGCGPSLSGGASCMPGMGC
jgi:hypothetical protein